MIVNILFIILLNKYFTQFYWIILYEFPIEISG